MLEVLSPSPVYVATMDLNAPPTVGIKSKSSVML